MERRLSSPLHQNCYLNDSLKLLQSGYVFTEDVEFDVDNRVDADIAEVGMLECVGDDGYLEGV